MNYNQFINWYKSITESIFDDPWKEILKDEENLEIIYRSTQHYKKFNIELKRHKNTGKMYLVYNSMKKEWWGNAYKKVGTTTSFAIISMCEILTNKFPFLLKDIDLMKVTLSEKDKEYQLGYSAWILSTDQENKNDPEGFKPVLSDWEERCLTNEKEEATQRVLKFIASKKIGARFDL